ncbi:MAG TPA: N,N-dimethylformamidase beta subunit family domain-containing protein [Nitrospira sp.]|nr:N,N-dimethylformamidase beta subunit family domain-containing protein [Nitrospira sp.]
MRASLCARQSVITSRAVLLLVACIGILTQLQCGGGDDGGGSGQPPAGVTGDVRAIARENALPGTGAWQIGTPSRSGEIVAYSNRESYPAGSDVGISVSASPAGQFTWQVFRMGGYGGTGGRLYGQGGPVSAPTQANPSFDPATGLVRAGWPATFSFSTRNSDGSPWLTGVYVVLLTKSDGWQTYAIFILRDDTRNAEVALHLPTSTWHAYNEYGGESLYASTHGLSGGHARKVSLDRPITLGFGSGKFLFEEHEGVIWLEDMGYDVEYFTTSDIGGSVNRLGGHRVYVTLAHDEYATMATMDRLQAALAGGTSLAFLTGNTYAWQIRYEDNDRTIVGYKDLAAQDPVQGPLRTGHFRDSVVNRPENGLIGVMSDGSDNVSNGAPSDWVVTNANHWVYAGTGLTDGAAIPSMIYYEWDGLVDNGATPAGLTVLASSVVPNNVLPGSRHEATVYERGSAVVFAAGTIHFNQRLRADSRVAQILKNVLTRAGATAYVP